MAIEISEAMQEAINGALMSGQCITISALTPGGEPNVSFRGSVQSDGSDELVLWTRNPEGSLAKSIALQPKVVLTYGDFSTRNFFMCSGRAWIESSEPRRSAVYDGMVAGEQERDPERGGTAIVVQLDSVAGVGADGYPTDALAN